MMQSQFEARRGHDFIIRDACGAWCYGKRSVACLRSLTLTDWPHGQSFTLLHPALLTVRINVDVHSDFAGSVTIPSDLCYCTTRPLEKNGLCYPAAQL